MPYYLQKLPWLIKPPFVILRPIPDRRGILPHFSAAESIDRVDDRVNVVIFAGRNIPLYYPAFSAPDIARYLVVCFYHIPYIGNNNRSMQYLNETADFLSCQPILRNVFSACP